MQVLAPRRSSVLRSAALLGAALAAVGAAPATAGAEAEPNAVYTATNNPNGNQLVVFKRKANGSLQRSQTLATRGKGTAEQPPLGLEIVDSQGSVNIEPDGDLVFVVNSGDNTITSFHVNNHGARFVQRVTSGGILPVSIARNGNRHLLYVLNEESGSVFGYRYKNNGRMTPIVNGEQALSTVGPTGVAAQISFTPNGKALIVSERHFPAPHGAIDTIRLRADGSPRKATSITSDDAHPFGFDFSGNHMIISNIGPVPGPPNPFDGSQFTGSATSYGLNGSGSLSLVGTVASGGRAACWVQVSKDGKFAFVTNTLSDSASDPHALVGSGKGAISRYSIGSDGSLTLLPGNVDASNAPGHPSFPADMALSSNGKFLYVLAATTMEPPTTNDSQIKIYKVGSNGSLTPSGSAGGLPNGVSGLGAH